MRGNGHAAEEAPSLVVDRRVDALAHEGNPAIGVCEPLHTQFKFQTTEYPRVLNVPNSDLVCRNRAGVSLGRGRQALQVVVY